MARTREEPAARRGVVDARVAGLLLAASLGLAATLVGVRAGYQVQDVDEAVYRRTLRSMRAGEGYYPAMRDALVEKEGAPPSSVRAVRPPTLFLALRPFPEGSLRWVAGLAYVAILYGAFQLARPFGLRAAVAGCLAAFLWVATASPYLFLHGELWGSPLLIAALLRLRRGDDGGASALTAAATAIRELFGIALLLGLLLRRRRPWLVAAAAVAGAATLHAALAREILSPSGREAALGNEPISLRFVLRAISPGDGPVAWAVGAALLAGGVLAVARLRRRDAGAALLLPFASIMVILGIVFTRSYWALTWGPALASFAVGAVVVRRAQPAAVARGRGPH